MRGLLKISFCLLLSGCIPLPKNVDVNVTWQENVSPAPVELAATQNIKGYDFLGLAKQDCAYIAQTIDPGTAIGVLQGTFGDIRPCLKTILDTGKVKAVRVHNIDATTNAHGCYGNVTDPLFLANKLKIIKAFADQYPNVRWFDSPALEHNCVQASIVNKWYVQIAQLFPQATPVCSTGGQGWCPSNVLKENHGGGGGDISSTDGTAVWDVDSVSFLTAGKYLSLGWSNGCNGRLSSEKPGDPVPPPMQRTNWLTHDEIQHLVRIMRTPSIEPKIMGCKEIVAPNISKVRSEKYSNGLGDSRQDKPMVILNNANLGRISLQTTQGKEVGCFSPYGPYAGGGYRYYEGNCSGLTAPQVMDAFGGNEWGKIVGAGNQCYMYEAIRRLGVYR